MSEPKVFVFDKKEIIVFLIVFICINVLFFALGVKVGQINPDDTTHKEETHGSDHADAEHAPTEHAQEHAKTESPTVAHPESTHEGDHKDLKDEVKNVDQHAKVEHPPEGHAEPAHGEAPKDGEKKIGFAEETDQKAQAEHPVKDPEVAHEKVEKKADTKKLNWGQPFYIQIGSFLEEADAKTMQSNLKKEGVSTYVIKAKVDGVSRYRVGFGDFSSRQAAQKDMKRLQDLTGIEPALQKRD